MILGLGVDICPVNRIEEVLERQGVSFEEKVFTDGERRYSVGKAKGDRLAARWAAKEAGIKALGAPEGLHWHDLEVRNREDGAPTLIMRGAAAERAKTLGVTNTLLTLSHAGGMAVAVVILEGLS